MKTLEEHFTHIESIVRNSGAVLEGNCVYSHTTFDRPSQLEPKQRNLTKVASHGNRIMEIGFNAGHSALLFLMGNPTCTLQLFDLGDHAYTENCFDYLQQEFPNRLSIIWGDSTEQFQNLLLII